MRPEALAAAVRAGKFPVDIDLFGGSPLVESDVEILSVTHDSRSVGPGSLFCCVRGKQTDGHLFAADAVAAGAVALLVDHRLDLAVTQFVVADVRAAMSTIGGALHGYPGDHLSLIGITGTNGKTTTAHLLGAMLEAAGYRIDVIGTLTQMRTTPEATDLQERLAVARATGCSHVVMEVTSHALELHRVAALHFDVAVFTNLSRDHLDFHNSEEAYFRAKARLFMPQRSSRAVVNGDDPHGRLLFGAADIPAELFGLRDAVDLKMSSKGSRFTWRDVEMQLQLAGEFNVLNALGAASAASALGVSSERIAAGVAGVASVRGRFENVLAGQTFGVVVDYAHTPDGLERVLRAARSVLGTGRLITVFGCGGDRDRGKRPLMGEIASRLSDVAILTSDNPRTEDPLAIIAEVEAGTHRADVLRVEPDRRHAIELALRMAGEHDMVVLAGKGHEQGQEMAGVVYPFDDRAVAEEILQAIL